MNYYYKDKEQMSTETNCQKSKQILNESHQQKYNDDERNSIFRKCASDWAIKQYGFNQCSEDHRYSKEYPNQFSVECQNFMDLQENILNQLNTRYSNLQNVNTNPNFDWSNDDGDGKKFNDNLDIIFKEMEEQAPKKQSWWRFSSNNGGRRSKRTKRNRKKRRSTRRKKHSL